MLLPRDPHGHADQSIGKNVANGNVGLIAPNLIISKDFEEVTLDGVKMVFQNTPDTEAPVEMNTWFPQFKAFWAAENITGTIHNVYTPRGAPVRNALNWSKQINAALYKFGQEAEVMFASHSWPRWGNARIQEVMRVQRDTYANLNNQSLHYANLGVTVNEIQNVYQLPPSLWKQWPAHSYHGSEQHNSRGVINRFLGYWDGNPVHHRPALPEGFGAAVRRDDGRLRQDHGQGQTTDRPGQVPRGHGNPESPSLRRATQPAGQGPAGRCLRAARLPEGESDPAQHIPARSF